MTDTKRKKRPRDTSQLAKFIVDVATGEEEGEEKLVSKKSNAGKKGGKARARALTPQRLSEIASIAANARWKKS